LTIHETDPCQSLLGAPISLSLSGYLKPLNAPIVEKTEDDVKEENAEMERFLRRWIACQAHSSRILKEMENIVSRLDCRISLKRGEFIGVDPKGLPDSVRFR
jgi:hypothetical protein